MNAMDLLTNHHRELETRFAELKHASNVEQSLFDEVADSLAAHITVEAELF